MSEDAPTRQAVGIAEVAALAGVSTATVSRALSNPEKLRAATLARVAEAVRRTGYTPNVAARSLRGRRTMVVLVVVPDIANPLFADVLQGIDDELSRHGYGLLIGNLARLRAKEAEMLEIVQAGQVDGVILLNGHVPEDRGRALTDLGIPLVAICEAIPGAAFPQVDVRNREAAQAAVEHLVSLGHRRIAYLAGPEGNILERDRRAGFCAGLAQAGIAETAACFLAGDFSFRAGTDAAAAFLAMPDRPTALFAANDEMAIGFLKAVRDAGLRIPGDISIVGFDGIAFADYVDPVLTTFRQPRHVLGVTGAGLLVKVMNGTPVAPDEARQRLPVELLARASSGPPG
jgi:LacI family repressor for deo operon, udp, cdd, tsx, nupC, and nupG